MANEAPTEPISLRITPRQMQVIATVCRELSIDRADLLRGLIDTHLDPIAVRHGLAEKSKLVEATSLEPSIPGSLKKLTRSQLSCLVDMFSAGWKVPDLAGLYFIDEVDIEALFAGKSPAEVRQMRSRLRQMVNREKRKWLQRGEI